MDDGTPLFAVLYIMYLSPVVPIPGATGDCVTLEMCIHSSRVTLTEVCSSFTWGSLYHVGRCNWTVSEIKDHHAVIPGARTETIHMDDPTGVTPTISSSILVEDISDYDARPISIQLVTNVNQYSKISPRTLEYSSKFGTDVARKAAGPPNEQPWVMMRDLDRIIQSAGVGSC